MTRRAPALRAAGLVVPLLLVVAGCGLLERAPDLARIVNESDDDVVVHRIEPEDRYSALVEAGGSGAFPLDECTGERIVVETTDGAELATFDEPLCPRSRIVIDADSEVTYDKHG
ncbi:hypothetical protein [Cellulomonas pakistanensis]|uniref:Lipoprotein n=1 Tax=Cellulomonas pakistanensis TaxID=992287 RepID=A0A919U7J0_9CELL|nr:hypothetical protein [Cellulomonas pakistanensis]GIG37405.1 hypothetical protein Cpa01nite_27860 [Cellulomonas pakistanensis]